MKRKIIHQVVIEKQAQKNSPKYHLLNIKALQRLYKTWPTFPRPQGYKKLKGHPGFRIHLANYRIICNIEENILTVFILIILHRKDVYE